MNGERGRYSRDINVRNEAKRVYINFILSPYPFCEEKYNALKQRGEWMCARETDRCREENYVWKLFSIYVRNILYKY